MNRIFLLLTGIFLFVYATLTAQPFEQYAASVQGVGRSGVEWGD